MSKRAGRRSEAPAPALQAEPPPSTDDDSGFSMTGCDTLSSAERFDEPMRGLQTRELRSPDIFWRYFGGNA